jgi:LEA14-like dessication related protein
MKEIGYRKNWATTILALLGVLIITGLYGCRVEEVTIGQVERVELRQVSGKKLGFDLFLPIENPNSYGFKIKQVDLDIYLNNQYLGNLSNSDRIHVRKMSSEVYRFGLTIEFDSWIKGALSLAKLIGQRGVDFRMEGYIKVKKWMVDKKIPVAQETRVDLL